MPQKTLNAFILILAAVLAITAGGCDERIRKKFVRPTNQDKKLEKLEVVYQPVEYSSDSFDPAEQYEQNFHVWKAWHTDLRDAVEANDGLKRKKYLLEHVIDALGSMQYWLAPDGQKDFDGLVAELRKVDAEFQKPEAMQNDQLILRSLDIIQNKIQGEYDLGHVKDRLIQSR